MLTSHGVLEGVSLTALLVLLLLAIAQEDVDDRNLRAPRCAAARRRTHPCNRISDASACTNTANNTHHPALQHASTCCVAVRVRAYSVRVVEHEHRIHHLRRWVIPAHNELQRAACNVQRATSDTQTSRPTAQAHESGRPSRNRSRQPLHERVGGVDADADRGGLQRRNQVRRRVREDLVAEERNLLPCVLCPDLTRARKHTRNARKPSLRRGKLLSGGVPLQRDPIQAGPT